MMHFITNIKAEQTAPTEKPKSSNTYPYTRNIYQSHQELTTAPTLCKLIDKHHTRQFCCHSEVHIMRHKAYAIQQHQTGEHTIAMQLCNIAVDRTWLNWTMFERNTTIVWQRLIFCRSWLRLSLLNFMLLEKMLSLQSCHTS